MSCSTWRHNRKSTTSQLRPARRFRRDRSTLQWHLLPAPPRQAQANLPPGEAVAREGNENGNSLLPPWNWPCQQQARLHLGTQAGNTQLTKAQLQNVSRAAHKTGCQSVEVSVVFKSISLHYLAVFRQILVTILPSLLFRAPPVMHLTFLESVLGWGVSMSNIPFPAGML